MIFFAILAFTQIFGASPARIIGGQPARAGQYPFAAAIYITKPTGRYFCGGSLINNRNVLTSATCANAATLFTLEFGATTLNDVDDNRVQVSSSESVVHEDFDEATLENDIAIIHLRLAITYTDYIMPSYLPFERVKEGLSVKAIGWGQISDDEEGFSNELQTVDLVTLTNEECSSVYGNQIKDNMVCVSGNFDEGACTGDMGSGLIDVNYKIFWLVGIASFVSGNGCETSDPSGYTRVYEYLDWIKENMVS